MSRVCAPLSPCCSGSDHSFEPVERIGTSKVPDSPACSAKLADVNAGRMLPTQELKKSFEAEFGPIAWQ